METEPELETLESLVACYLIKEDAETLLALMAAEKDSIVSLEIMPYCALFIISIQEMLGEEILESDELNIIRNARNYIKAYSDGFSKTIRHIAKINNKQDAEFKNKLKFSLMKKWDIHYNLGIFFIDDIHMIGNSQMVADFLLVEDMFDPKNNEKYRQLGETMGTIVKSISEAFSVIPISSEQTQIQKKISIDFYYDLNTSKLNKIFINKMPKEYNLLFINELCNLNFVKYVLQELLDDKNKWLFRIEYVVTYYGYRLFQRYVNYCKNNNTCNINISEISDVINNGKGLFNSKFRNCMMHYGLKNQGVIKVENIEKPFYGIIESCYDGKKYDSLLSELRILSNQMIVVLEKMINMKKISLNSF